jgi:Xaa-Pro aminopeptidase
MDSAETLFDLPSDPDEAFVLFESRIREKFLGSTHEDSGDLYEKEYVQHLAAFIQVYQLDFGIDLIALVGKTGSQFWQGYNELSAKIRIYAISKALELNKIQKAGGSDVYILSPAQKLRIHKQLDEIRAIIEASTISTDKKEALLSRLNAFAGEVDRDRTRLQQLTATRVWMQREVTELVDVKEKIDNIFDIFSKATEYLKQLPSPKVPKQLPPPPKPESFAQDLDDEIPF